MNAAPQGKKPHKLLTVVLSILGGIITLVIIVTVIGAIFLSVTFTSFTNSHDKDYAVLKKEVARIESATGLKADTIDCHDVELAAECYVWYDDTSLTSIRNKFSTSDYNIDAGTVYQDSFTATKVDGSITAYVSWLSSSPQARAEFKVNH